MTFLSPIFLLGLPLVGLPIAIHLLNRRQRKVVTWGAMQFLMAGMTRRRRLWRIQDLLLLLFRVLVFLFFISALARPMIPLNWLGKSGPRDVVLVLDQSLSMSTRVGGARLFDLQLQKANEVLDQMEETDRLQVLLATDAPRWFLPEPLDMNARNRARVREQLQTLSPGLGSVNWPDCLDKALSLSFDRDAMAKIVVVITDRQREGWREDQGEIWKSIQDKCAQENPPVSMNVFQVGRDLESSENLSIDRIRSTRAICMPEIVYTWEAIIANRGMKSSQATTIEWLANEEAIGIQSVPSIEPGAEISIRGRHQFDQPGLYTLRGQLRASEPLEADNTGQWIVEVIETLPILVVEGISHADPGMTDSGFVLAALGYHSRSTDTEAWRSVFEPRVIQADALDSVQLSDYRCVILSNLPRLSSAFIDRLERYVSKGGGLWMALGHQTQMENFNQLGFKGGQGLSPLPMEGVEGDPENSEEFIGIQPPSSIHPATQLLGDTERLDLDKVQVYRHALFQELQLERVSILMRADHGAPLVVERPFGAGRVVVQGVPFNVHWSDLPLRQSFVAMLHEFLWYLTEPSMMRRNLNLGEPLIQKLAKQTELPDARLERPDGGSESLFVIEEDEENWVQWGQVYEAGAYRLVVQPKQGSVESYPYWVQRRVEESNLQPLEFGPESALRSLQWNQDLLEVKPEHQLQVPDQPLDHGLLLLLALVLMGEMVMGAWMIRQRSRPVQPISLAMK